jgi:hypothetical protein
LEYRSFVGPEQKYDLVAAIQFNLLVFLGLREHHSLLDIGCGSLRGGRLFIPYLLPDRYYGIEPEEWLLEEGIKNEVGRDLIRLKRPVFSNDNEFTLSIFGREFDFVLAQSIFSHASKKQIRTCLSEARKVMKDTSIFAATFVEGRPDYKGGTWVYPDCINYSFETLCDLASENGLKCQKIDWSHPNLQSWIALTIEGSELKLPQLTDPQRFAELKAQLETYKQKLNEYESHPYVRFGLKVQRLLRPLARLRQKNGT